MTSFFTLFVLSRTTGNTTSQNIGGTDAWAVPHLKCWGTVPPFPPRSLPMLIALGQISHPLSSASVNDRNLAKELANGNTRKWHTGIHCRLLLIKSNFRLEAIGLMRSL